MKVNRKFLAASAVLALSSMSSAFAAPIPLEGLFFSARDNTTNTSIVINLGLTTADFRANPNAPYTLGATESAALGSWLTAANQGTVIWSVMGINDDGSGPNIPPSQNYGGLSTSTNIEDIYADWGSFGGLDATVSQNTTYRDIVNQQLGSSNVFATSGASAFHFAGQDGGVGFASLAGIGGSMNFYQFFANPDSSFSEGGFIEFAGQWALNLAGGIGSLSYSGGGAPVPVPAAIWLLGSGLLGMAGIARRKKV